jgi:hypothetical protein
LVATQVVATQLRKETQIPNYLSCNYEKEANSMPKFVGHLDPQLIKRKEGQMKKGVFILTASKGIRMSKLVTWKKLSIILNAFSFGGT